MAKRTHLGSAQCFGPSSAEGLFAHFWYEFLSSLLLWPLIRFDFACFLFLSLSVPLFLSCRNEIILKTFFLPYKNFAYLFFSIHNFFLSFFGAVRYYYAALDELGVLLLGLYCSWKRGKSLVILAKIEKRTAKESISSNVSIAEQRTTYSFVRRKKVASLWKFKFLSSLEYRPSPFFFSCAFYSFGLDVISVYFVFVTIWTHDYGLLKVVSCEWKKKRKGSLTSGTNDWFTCARISRTSYEKCNFLMATLLREYFAKWLFNGRVRWLGSS